MELLLRGVCVCVLQCVYSIKCKHGVPVLNYVSGQAGGRVWVSAGVRTWSEGKGPTNAEWQLIMPDRYISICPPAPCLPLWACCCRQAFQQRHAHADTHAGATTRLPCECFTFCSKQSLAQNLIKQRLCGASSHCNKLHFHLMCAYLICKHKTHISTQRRVKPHFKTETKLHFIFQVGCVGYAVDERGLWITRLSPSVSLIYPCSGDLIFI